MLMRRCVPKPADRLGQPIARNDREGLGSAYYYDAADGHVDDRNSVLPDVSIDSKGEATLRIAVFREGTDRLYSDYLFAAGKTQSEIKAWLQDTDGCLPVLLERAKDLSDRVNRHPDRTPPRPVAGTA